MRCITTTTEALELDQTRLHGSLPLLLLLLCLLSRSLASGRRSRCNGNIAPSVQTRVRRVAHHTAYAGWTNGRERCAGLLRLLRSLRGTVEIQRCQGRGERTLLRCLVVTLLRSRRCYASPALLARRRRTTLKLTRVHPSTLRRWRCNRRCRGSSRCLLQSLPLRFGRNAAWRRSHRLRVLRCCSLRSVLVSCRS